MTQVSGSSWIGMLICKRIGFSVFLINGKYFDIITHSSLPLYALIGRESMCTVVRIHVREKNRTCGKLNYRDDSMLWISVCASASALNRSVWFLRMRTSPDYLINVNISVHLNDIIFLAYPTRFSAIFSRFGYVHLIRGGVRQLWSCPRHGQRHDKICIMLRIVNSSFRAQIVQPTQSPCCLLK